MVSLQVLSHSDTLYHYTYLVVTLGDFIFSCKLDEPPLSVNIKKKPSSLLDFHLATDGGAIGKKGKG